MSQEPRATPNWVDYLPPLNQQQLSAEDTIGSIIEAFESANIG